VITEKGDRIVPKRFATTSAAHGKNGMKDFSRKAPGSKFFHFSCCSILLKPFGLLWIKSREAGRLFIVGCSLSMIYEARTLMLLDLDSGKSSDSSRPMVTFRHVCKEYLRGQSRVLALWDVDVDIPQGEFCALMGPSGSGKSTFLNLIAGLDNPTSGDILLEGKCTENFEDKEWTKMRREWLGIVFQAFHLVPGLTAAENVALPLRLRGTSDLSIRSRVDHMLKLVGLEDRADHHPHELSGGEQQRVAIARAFVHQPRLILADEPTGNLDSRNGAEVVALLRHCSQEFGQTVILATHSETAAIEADRRLTLHDGRLN